MKGLKTYWRTALIAALFILGLVFILHREPADSDLYLWDLKAEQVASIEVAAEGSRIRLTSTDGRWSWEEAGRSIPIDDKKFSWRLEMILHPRADGRLDIEAGESPKDSRYGLKPSMETIVITDTNGQQFRLLVGSRTPLQRHYYVRLPEQSAIRLVPVSILAPLLQLKKEDVTTTDTTVLHEGIREEDSPGPAQSPRQ